MSENEAIDLIIDHLNGLFPKTCPNCQHRYESLRDFYLETTAMGNAVSYDLEKNDLQPEKPLGAVAVSNCRCGAALSLSSDGMPLFRYWSLLLWAKGETRRRSISVAELLVDLRTRVRKRAVVEAGGRASQGPRSV
jgi:hypothetical protein